MSTTQKHFRHKYQLIKSLHISNKNVVWACLISARLMSYLCMLTDVR